MTDENFTFLSLLREKTADEIIKATEGKHGTVNLGDSKYPKKYKAVKKIQGNKNHMIKKPLPFFVFNKKINIEQQNTIVKKESI